MNLESVVLVLASLLWIAVGVPEADSAEMLLSGRHEVTGHRGALVVVDGEVVVPAGAEVAGPVYLVGGELLIEGAVRGDLRQLAGRLVVEDGARIGGELQHISGTQRVASSADIGRRTSVEVVPAEPSAWQRVTSVGLVALLLALVGARRARRNPRALGNVHRAVVRHPVVSLTVGALVGVTFLSLFVFMAFTLVLIPVAVLGLLAGVVAVAYGVIALGHLAGQRLPTPRAGLATAVGVVVVVVALQLLGAVPVVGGLLALVVVLAGLGAVLVTYFGLQEFRPATLPE